MGPLHICGKVEATSGGLKGLLSKMRN